MGTVRSAIDAGRMPKPVIAAIDPFREDEAPAALGLVLARLTSAPLVLVGASPMDPYADVLVPEFRRGSRRQAEQAIRRMAALIERAPGQPVLVTTTVADSGGSAARALHDVARREDASILVIGSSTRGPVGRLLPSAVTDGLLRGAPCSVAVAPVGYSVAQAGESALLIGVGFNDSPDSRAALSKACTLAIRGRGHIRVLTVAEPLHPIVTGTLDAMAADDVRRERDAAAEATLERGLDAVSAGRSAGGEVLFGNAADALAVASQDLDLLVCGSRGRGPIRALVLGGTSHALVRKAACPVLVVPAGVSGADAARPARSTASSTWPGP
jgi:nucleotide-binding universal stress UspA family protein